MKRRAFLFAPWLLTYAARAAPSFAPVSSGEPIRFPRDHGSHPAFRTEWWYLTGWARTNDGRDLGVQVTFFRTRPGVNEASPSRFAPTQLLFAHAAIGDPRTGRLRHDQRAARAGFGIAEAAETTTDVRIDDWSLRLDGDTYLARIDAREFTLALAFAARDPILLQGAGGVSRKGPRPEQASYYYSRPQLAIAGTIASAGGSTDSVRGTAWLDHEWSSEYLAPEAQGWDWIGVNFDDGGALMAFRIRGKNGNPYWAGGATRDASGVTRSLEPGEVRFTALRSWRSPRTGIEYPIAFRVQAGARDITLEPLFADQELDSRASVGTIYWEGAVSALAGESAVGRGYLELTGYGAPLKI